MNRGFNYKPISQSLKVFLVFLKKTVSFWKSSRQNLTSELLSFKFTQVISCDEGGGNGTAAVLFSLKKKTKATIRNKEHCLIEATMKLLTNCGGALGAAPKPPALVL